MSDYTFIQKVDEALTNIIWNGIKSEPAIQSIISSIDEISFSSPKAAQKTKKISIFLYNLNPNVATKNTPPHVDSLRDKYSLVLRYLVTPTTGDDENDHIVLGKVIQTLLSNPVFPVSDLGNVGDYRITMDSISLDELTNLWTAIGAPLRLSASFAVSAEAEINEHQETEVLETALVSVKGTSRLKEMYQIVNQTFIGQATDWEKSNLFRKQWVMLDFKKSTGMSVEDMLKALESLGEKLEQDLPTQQSMESLNALTGYYKHVQQELTQFSKLSPKQKKNVEVITKWISDLNALTEALNVQKTSNSRRDA